MLEIGVILVLVLINGLLAMAEVGIVASRKARLREQAAAGVKGAQSALEALDSPVRFLSTVQFGITLIGILSGVFGGATIADKLAARFATVPSLEHFAQPLALGVVVVLITYFSLVLGELAPKRFAMEHPEAVARRAVAPMRLLAALASPAVRFLSFSTNVVLRPFGVGGSRAESVSEEEIRSMIRLGAASGVLDREEREVIERVFSIADRRVGSFMIPRRDVICLAPDATPAQAAAVLRESRDAHFPVSESGLDELLGVVSALELARQMGTSPRALVRAPLYIPDTANALRAIELFRKENAQIAFITDEHGTIEGMVRLSDLLEEILGQGHPNAEPAIVARADGSLLLDGLASLADFLEASAETWSEEFDTDSFHTLGGLLAHRLGRLPKTGDVLTIGAWRSEVVDMDGRRVDKILAQRVGHAGGRQGS
ncbi:MAG: HlyC/CorC family transporter [Phycisphaerales bacterium]|nr:HlyC/CorC family transporter [Phycisphaerales bacterium]